MVFRRLSFRVARGLATIQDSLSAKHTAYYILTESLVYGITVTLLIFLSGVLLTLEVVFLLASFVAFSLSSYIVLITRKQSDSPAVAEFTPWTVFVLICVSSLSLAFGFGVRESLLPVALGLLSLLVYIIALQYRNRRYLGVPEFFVNKYSDSQSHWIEASVSLERAVQFADSSPVRSYYWSLRAERSYTKATETESLQLRELAAEFASVSNMISAAMRSDSPSVYMSEAYRNLNKAVQMAKNQLCDNCGRQMHVGSISGMANSVSRCGHCRTREDDKNTVGNSGTANQTNRTTRKRRTRRRRQNKWEDWESRTRKESKNRNRKSDDAVETEDEDFELSVEESREILGLGEVTSVDAVTESFRTAVKDVHPDAGGSAEEFRRVKRAKDRLVNHLQSSDN